MIEFVFLQKKKPDSEIVSSPPPPLPPPIAPDDIPNGDMTRLILVLQNGSGTEVGKRPVPIPRAHVYEVVPNNIITVSCWNCILYILWILLIVHIRKNAMFLQC